MKPLAILVLLASLATAQPAPGLKVLTFNVRYPNPGDGPDAWPQRRDLLVDVIRAAAADLIGTQELFAEQGDYIAAQLPQYRWFGVSRRGDRTDEHMGVFYKADRFRIVESGNYWLSETPNRPGSSGWGMSLPRMVTWALFEDKSGARFYFYNTHFPHRREDAAARLRCAKLIASRLPKDAPVILTGDFNTGLDSDAYRELTASLKDACKEAGQVSGPSGTFHAFKGTPGADRIDWILFRGPWKAISVETITTNRDGRYPSDHFPVLAAFQ